MKNSYEKYRRKTYIIVLIFLITSFLAIQKIQTIIDIDGYIETDIIEIEDNNSLSNSNVNNSVSDNNISNIEDSNSNSSDSSMNSSNSNNVSSDIIKDIYEGDTSKEIELVRETNIFSNKYFNNKNLVAPGVSGVYKFKIINNKNTDVLYSVNTVEDNRYNINLEYRLKCDNKYVISNWVSAKELLLTNILLEKNKSHLYILEWRWPYESNSDELDTKIGEQGASYSLKITVVAQEI